MPTQTARRGRRPATDMSRTTTGRWSPYTVVARAAGGRAARDLAVTLPDATARELRVAGEAVRDGVEDMPDLLRTGFVVALLVSLVAPLRRLIGLREVERFGTGLGLAAVFDARRRDDR
ncbi:MAG TPA: hypothetical protein VF069_10320 [Streptosporangiaceae bacterium]